MQRYNTSNWGEHMFQKLVCQMAPSPSPQRWWTSSILSTDLHIPLQLQSKDAAQGFPAWAFHSQSINKNQYLLRNILPLMHMHAYLWGWTAIFGRNYNQEVTKDWFDERFPLGCYSSLGWGLDFKANRSQTLRVEDNAYISWLKFQIKNRNFAKKQTSKTN